MITHLEGNYLAVNVFYRRDFHNTSISYFYQQGSSLRKEDDFRVKKTVFSIPILTGIQESIGKRLMLDFYTGFGIRFRNISTVSKEFDYNRDELIQGIHLTIRGVNNEIDTKAGKSVVPNFTMGIRLCYKL